MRVFHLSLWIGLWSRSGATGASWWSWFVLYGCLGAEYHRNKDNQTSNIRTMFRVKKRQTIACWH